MQTEVISFFSDVDNKTYYSDHARRLAVQLNGLGISFDIREKPSLGSYQQNCLSKPQFIYQLLIEKQKPLVWLDIDSDVRKPLNIFDAFVGNADMALACANNKLYSAKASPIYFAFNSKVLDFLQHWISSSRQMASLGKWFDHEILIGLLHSFYNKDGFIMKFVGPEYCVWPGEDNENSVIVMGLTDIDSKKNALKELGMTEEAIAWQTPGTK